MKTSSTLRLGVTLVEVLLVIALIAGVLFLLIVPAIQQVRDAAIRTQCLSQMRQCGLAMHTTQDAWGYMPAAWNQSYRTPGYTFANPNMKIDGSTTMSWAFWLIPFMESTNIYDYFKATPGANSNTGSYGEPGVTATVPPASKLFRCPSDPSGPRLGPNLAYAGTRAASVPATNYVANWQFLSQRKPSIPEACPDGASVTVLFYERYGFGCGANTGINVWGNTVLNDVVPVAYWLGAPTADGPKFQPLPRQANCDPLTVQGMHRGGTVVAMCDASVKLVSNSVSITTWSAACTPDYKDTVGPDW